MLATTISLASGLTLIAAPTASAASKTHGDVVVNCSWGSCSYYVSREGTRRLKQVLELNEAAAVGTGTVCTILGIAGIAACTTVGGAILTGAKIAEKVVKDAVEDHPPKGACFKVTRSHVGGTIYPSTNMGKFCDLASS